MTAAPRIPTLGPWARGRGASVLCAPDLSTLQEQVDPRASPELWCKGLWTLTCPHTECTHTRAYWYAYTYVHTCSHACALVHINACTCLYADLHTKVRAVCTHEHIRAPHTFTRTDAHMVHSHVHKVYTHTHTHRSLLAGSLSDPARCGIAPFQMVNCVQRLKGQAGTGVCLAQSPERPLRNPCGQRSC